VALRIDKWLWCARFYKSRALATAAVAGGKVHLNGERVKPGRTIDVGDALRITQGGYQRDIVVQAIPERRGPAAEAQRCYEETAGSIQRRERLREQHALAAAVAPRPPARPDKRERRRLLRLHRQQG
jgi:ribosome-associated heat shock protein Hsp15